MYGLVKPRLKCSALTADSFKNRLCFVKPLLCVCENISGILNFPSKHYINPVLFSQSQHYASSRLVNWMYTYASGTLRASLTC